MEQQEIAQQVKLRTRLDLTRPDLGGKVFDKQNVLGENKQTGPVSDLVRDQLWKRPVDQIHQTQIEPPDRSADVKETFPRSNGNKQIVDFGEIQTDVLRTVC